LVRNAEVKQILFTALSKMIITKTTGVSLAIDVSHSRPHKKYEKAPVSAFQQFIKSVESVLEKAPFSQKNLFDLPMPKIVQGDSRALPFPNNYFDAIVTSPPYLNAIDYLRASKMSLVWMGYSINSLQKIRSGNIGSERKICQPDDPSLMNALQKIGSVEMLPSREKGFTYRYVKDMHDVLSEVARVLKPGGKAIFVVGNSTLKNVYLSNSDAIIALGEKLKLSLTSQTERVLPDNKRYMPSPLSNSKNTGITNRMRTEVVIEFVKVSHN